MSYFDESFSVDGIIHTEDFASPEKLYNDLVNAIASYHPSKDMSMIEMARRMAEISHGDQKRKSGEPYIIHPLSVALILADLRLDKETIIAGLLHDVVEDTKITLGDVEEIFNAEVALVVDGVTKLERLSYSADKADLKAESLKKMFLAMAKDIRVLLVKLADRLHNLRTLQYMKPHKRVEIAKETLDIYAPMADRLGIAKIKMELEDLSLKYMEPEMYDEIVEQIELKKSMYECIIRNIIKDVRHYLDEAGMKAELIGRVKHYFSIYKKIKAQEKNLDGMYDLFAVKIIVDTDRECYSVLGIIHEMYKPMPGRFKDYIAMPKPNMYQSLHTTLIGPDGKPFEVQIRTKEMHKTAAYGITAHWKYQEGEKAISDYKDGKLNWLDQILEWQQDFTDNKEYMTIIKDDFNLLVDSVYCFTPVGNVKNLPQGSTPIDFAYAVHTDMGNKFRTAVVNGIEVPLDYKLNNGDQVRIITSDDSEGPALEWLSIVRSTRARNKIRQWCRQHAKMEEAPAVPQKTEQQKPVAPGDMYRKYAKCCSPVHGDEIVGYMTRRRGLIIHRKDCATIAELMQEKPERIVSVDWAEKDEQDLSFTVCIMIACKSRVGILGEVLEIFLDRGIDIKAVDSKKGKDNFGNIEIKFETAGKDELDQIMKCIHKIEGVTGAKRRLE